MKTSIFDIFKIGIGPSSSHTVGPMRAAGRFVRDLERQNLLGSVAQVMGELFGSLALTGLGHGTDRAVLLGLAGEIPEEVQTSTVEPLLDQIRGRESLSLLGKKPIAFHERTDLLFHNDQILPGHPNGMRFQAFDESGTCLLNQVYYSIGGGFIVLEGERPDAAGPLAVPYPFSSGEELLGICAENGLSIADLMMANETTLRSEAEVRERLGRIWSVMNESIDRGLRTDGILPGGLGVRRRAPKLWAQISGRTALDPLSSIDLVNVFAMAVNEENAAGGRVVTAPTNGASGLLPAVARYYLSSIPQASGEGLQRFLLTSGAIGILYKENASISGAEVGCQGEVGVACSMAAAGLAAALGASNEQVEHAAEIGMEHNLGMTCDPIGGLVQIPCIERNAIGAVKAINACRMAMQEGEGHKVSLDEVIRTMYQTGLDMQSRYKETALAGLAVNVKDC